MVRTVLSLLELVLPGRTRQNKKEEEQEKRKGLSRFAWGAAIAGAEYMAGAQSTFPDETITGPNGSESTRKYAAREAQGRHPIIRSGVARFNIIPEASGACVQFITSIPIEKDEFSDKLPTNLIRAESVDLSSLPVSSIRLVDCTSQPGSQTPGSTVTGVQ